LYFVQVVTRRVVGVFVRFRAPLSLPPPGISYFFSFFAKTIWRISNDLNTPEASQ
jgi:hypothetical protein